MQDRWASTPLPSQDPVTFYRVVRCDCDMTPAAACVPCSIWNVFVLTCVCQNISIQSAQAPHHNAHRRQRSRQSNATEMLYNFVYYGLAKQNISSKFVTPLTQTKALTVVLICTSHCKSAPTTVPEMTSARSAADYARRSRRALTATTAHALNNIMLDLGDHDVVHKVTQWRALSWHPCHGERMRITRR